MNKLLFLLIIGVFGTVRRVAVNSSLFGIPGAKRCHWAPAGSATSTDGVAVISAKLALPSGTCVQIMMNAFYFF